MKIIVLDRGNVEFLYPGEWTVSRGQQGSVTLSDPTESCRLDVSYTRLPAGATAVPPEAVLTSLLQHISEAEVEPDIENVEEPARSLAWCDYEFVTQDKRTGNPKTARGRWLVGQNDTFQILMTYYYWEEDASWAVPAWKGIVETIQLGDGRQLSRPEEHWSMRERH